MAQLDEDCTTLQSELGKTVVAEAAKSKDKARWTLYRILLFPLMPLILILAAMDLYDFVYDVLPAGVRCVWAVRVS